MPLNLQIHLRLIDEYFKRLLECGGDGCCLAGLEEKDGLLANVEVDEADLVSDVRAELGSDDGVPRGAVFVVERLFDVESDVLLQVKLTDSFFSQSDSVGFECVRHVA